MKNLKSKNSRTTSIALALLITLIGVASFAISSERALADNPHRPFGDVQVLATVPFPPGFPEGIAVDGKNVYVAGPASFDTAGTLPSKVFAFDTKTGAFESEPHENLFLSDGGWHRLDG